LGDVLVKIELVYNGAVRLEEGRLGYAYTPVDGIGQLAERAWTFPEPLTSHPVGSHLSFDCASGDRQAVIGSTGVYLRAWHEQDVVLTWDAAHLATVASERALELDPPPRLVDAIQPLRDAYVGMTTEERAVLLAQVVQGIVRGS